MTGPGACAKTRAGDKPSTRAVVAVMPRTLRRFIIAPVRGAFDFKDVREPIAGREYIDDLLLTATFNTDQRGRPHWCCRGVRLAPGADVRLVGIFRNIASRRTFLAPWRGLRGF